MPRQVACSSPALQHPGSPCMICRELWLAGCLQRLATSAEERLQTCAATLILLCRP